jgi:putative transcriptional regulator
VESKFAVGTINNVFFPYSASAIEHAEGKPVKAIVHKPAPVNVKAIREKVSMTQTEFAVSFGISLDTLRHWERGDRKPHRAALVLLNVVAREPKAILRALSRGQSSSALNSDTAKRDAG